MHLKCFWNFRFLKLGPPSEFGPDGRRRKRLSSGGAKNTSPAHSTSPPSLASLLSSPEASPPPLNMPTCLPPTPQNTSLHYSIFPEISLSHDDLLSSHSSAAAYSLSVFLSPPLPLLLPISLPRPLQIFNWLCHLLLPWSHSIFSTTFSAPTFQGQIMHKIAHFTSFLHLFAREIYVCLSLLTLGVCQKESESRFSFKHGGKHFDKFFLEGETQKSVALCRKHITLSMWAGWCPLPLLSWWRYCVFWQKRFKILRLVTISGQNQAYAQAALQYAYAPNMLTAQQLTAAGLSYLLSFKMCLGCLYSVVFRNIIARPKRPYPCPSLPSILGLTSPGFPAYAAAAGSNKFHETQLSHTIWNLDTSFCGHKWICLPGPAPAGQANPQQQPAEQRIQWEGGENFFYIFARRKETIIYGLSLFPGHVQYRIGRIWKEK